MRIGIDISQIAYKGTGVGRFVHGLTEAICNYGKDHEWVFFYSGLRLKLDHKIHETIKKNGFKLVKASIPPTVLSFLWNTLHIKRIESFTGELDWFITSDWTEPPARAKKATVIHDLTVFRYPKTVDNKILRTQKSRLKRVAKESSIVFADSDATVQDIKEFLPKFQGKVRRIYPGVEVQPVSTRRSEELKKKLDIRKKFILTVGKLEPRKNLDALLEAFEKVSPAHVELLIAGQHGWGPKLQPQKNVRMLGFVSDEELSMLYQECLFFIYPSLWEGFGYPVVEAMKHGAAIAVSNTSSLEEIARGTGLTFDPKSVDDIAHCIKLLCENKNTRDDLKRKGLKRSQDFSWKSYYLEMEKVLSSS